MGVRIIIGINRINVETALSKKNRSKKWLSEKLGTVPAYLSQLLHGHRTPSPQMRIKIESAFHKRLTWDDLFTIKRIDDDKPQ